MKTKIIVGIIGGNGQMGKFFKRFFEKNNCKVLVSSRTTKLTLIECAKQSDIIIVSVPINSAVDVIKKIGPHIKKDSLLIDTTSIKKIPVNAMLRHSKSEVIGMHPIFGPSVTSIKNQVVVLCPARGKKWISWVKKIFEKNKAKVKITTPENHDEMMSIIQGLNHFSTLSAAHAIKSLGRPFGESLEFSSPIYKLKMSMLGRILNQDPSMYASIEMMNPKNQKSLEAFIKSAKKLHDIISKKNKKEFLKYFKECADFFGPFKKDAEKITNKLIEVIAEE